MPPEDKGLTNGWNEWSRHVLLELERLNEELKETNATATRNKDETNKKIEDKVNCVLKKIEELKDTMTGKYSEVKESVTTLKVKVALVGGFAGLVVSGLVTLLVRLLSK